MTVYDRRRIFTVCIGVLAGCGDSTDAGPFADLADSFISTTFTVTRPGGEPVDVLAAGGLMRLGLDPDGTTSGTLVIPASVTGEEPINESMAGTATRTGNTLVLVQAADTFVRDIVWTIGPGTLIGNYTGPDATIDITLTAMQP